MTTTANGRSPASSRRRRRLFRAGLFVGPIILLAVGVGVYGRLTVARAVTDLEPPGRIVVTDDLRVHVRCLDASDDLRRGGSEGTDGVRDVEEEEGGAEEVTPREPTIWIDPGNASFTLDWAGLQPRLSELAPTCTWDRPGYGWSAPSRAPREAEWVARELHSVVQAVDAGPVLLVGHSIGALHVLVYARTHPENVAGLVLVDPAPPDLVRSTRFRESKARSLGYYRTMHLFSESGLLPVIGAVAGESALPRTARRLPEVRDEYLALSATPGFWETAIAELDAIEESADQVDRALDGEAPLADDPLVVLSAGIPDGIPETLLQEQRAEHRALASLSSEGALRPLPESGHLVHFDAPGAILDAVARVLAEGSDEISAVYRDEAGIPGDGEGR